MSRSRKKPIIKDNTGGMKQLRNRKLRQRVKQQLHIGAEFEEELSLDRELIDDYEVCDWVLDYRYPDYKSDPDGWWAESSRKAARK